MNKEMKTFNKQFFADRLKLKQNVFHLSVRSAAKEIGISASTLSRLNREMFIPDVYSYFLCCKWLNVEMDFFFR